MSRAVALLRLLWLALMVALFILVVNNRINGWALIAYALLVLLVMIGERWAADRVRQ